MRPDPTTIAFRFGYGLPLPAGFAQTPADMLALLAGPDQMARQFPGLTYTTLAPQLTELDRLNKARKEAAGMATKPAADMAHRAKLHEIGALAIPAAQALIARALASPDGLRERLAAFWADHFTVAPRRVRDRPLPATLIEDAIRPNLAGPFNRLLTAAITHPAMLGYLDQTASVGPNSRVGRQRNKGLNENLARELLELHTLGVGSAYSQGDVRQLAELLTGLSVNAQGTSFQRRRAEPGAETVLGKRYAGDSFAAIQAVLNDLALRPETAAHICRKLAVHFISATPDPTLLSEMEAAWHQSGGNLLAVYSALLNHPAAWAERAEKARQPVEFVICSLRALGVSATQVLAMDQTAFHKAILQPLAEMGQPWQAPPGPDGWPEDPARWITPQRLAARITWAMKAPKSLIAGPVDAPALIDTALGPRASQALRWAVPRAETPREALALVLASPEFNRR